MVGESLIVFRKISCYQKSCIIFQLPGPNEVGLKLQRDQTRLYSIASPIWFRGLMPLLSLRHYASMKGIFQSSGDSFR